MNATVTTACAWLPRRSAPHTGQSKNRGDADLVLSGGADSMAAPGGLIFFVLLGSAAVAKMDPASLCRPFDRRRSGLVMGRAVWRYSRRNPTPVPGALAYTPRLPATPPRWMRTDSLRLIRRETVAEASMKLALADAGIGPDGIDYINAHGTSTKLNDLAETLAIRKVFGNRAAEFAISSSKSLIGHLLAGSGDRNLSLRHCPLPGTRFTRRSISQTRTRSAISITCPEPDVHAPSVPPLSNSFGFGGQNGTIVIKKYSGGN